MRLGNIQNVQTYRRMERTKQIAEFMIIKVQGQNWDNETYFYSNHNRYISSRKKLSVGRLCYLSQLHGECGRETKHSGVVRQHVEVRGRSSGSV